MMDSEKYAELQRVFSLARDLSADQQKQFIAKLEDREIASELDSLLEFDTETDHLLSDRNASTVRLDPQTEAEVPPSRGGHAGVFTLGEKLGEGGFGSVYRGHQTEPIQRDVAVKLVKPGMGSASVLSRFDAERQTLAMLNHPAIAKVFDVGTTDCGVPYFAMELVEGLPIDQFCATHSLSVRQCLSLIEDTCQAVHHAHRRGILHRDIKPSNVLAFNDDNGSPRIKVIDFGISKAIQRDVFDDNSPSKDLQENSLTHQGQVLGTLEYMSPEQASLDSRELDIRTDVYSLGALLYKLLTSRPPIDRTKIIASGYWKIYETLMESKVARPSEIADLPSKDLDWIVLKAIHKDRNQRYATVNDFALDLRRFRTGDSVSARPPSLVYQIHVALRKHRLKAAASITLLLSLLVGALGSWWGWNTASQALDVAVIEREESERQRQRATDLNERLNQSLYSAQIRSAWQAAQEHRFPACRKLLHSSPTSLRGFEWTFVESMIDDTQFRTLKSADNLETSQMDLAPSGERLLCTRADGSVVCVDQAGRALWSWKGPSRATVARWLPDTQSLSGSDSLLEDGFLVGFYDGSIKRFDSSGVIVKKSVWPRRGAVYDLAIANGSDLFAACFGDQGVELLNKSTLSPQSSWKASARLSELRFNAPNRLVTGCGFDGEIHHFSDEPPNEQLAVKKLDIAVGWERLSEERSVILGPSAFQTLQWRDAAWQTNGVRLLFPVSHIHRRNGPAVPSSQEQQQPQETRRRKSSAAGTISAGHARVIRRVDHKHFIVGTTGGVLSIHSFESTEENSRILTRFEAAIRDIRIHPDGHSVFVSLADGNISRLPLPHPFMKRHSPREPQFLDNQASLTAACLLEDTRRIATLDDNGRLSIWSKATGERQLSAIAHDGPGWDVSFTSEMILTVGDDFTMAAWNRSDLKLLWRRKLSWGARAICASKNGQWIAAAPPQDTRVQEGTIGLYDHHGNSIGVLNGHDNWVLSMTSDRSGKRLISSSENRTIRVWEIASRQTIHELVAPKQSVAEHLLCGPDHQLVSGHRDGQVAIWNTKTGRLHQTLGVFGDQITGLGLISDRLVATSKSDPRMKVLNRHTGEMIAELPISENGIQRMLASEEACVVITNDQASRLRTASGNGVNEETRRTQVRIWNLMPTTALSF